MELYKCISVKIQMRTIVKFFCTIINTQNQTLWTFPKTKNI